MGWAPRDRVTGELLAGPERSDRAIAAAAGCSRDRVARVRRVLERAGEIPHVEPGRRTGRPRPRPLRRSRDRAVRVLVANPFRSDVLLARAARVSVTTVCEARHELESSGQIPPVPASRREVLHQRRRASRTRQAIVLGARSPKDVAAAAGVSRGAAWAALRRERARPPIPKPPLPPQPCEQCGNMFSPSRRQHVSRPQRYCSDACAYAADRARRRANRPPPEPKPPKITELPPMPPEIVLGGLCVQPGLKKEHRYVWASDRTEDREIARRYCKVCSVQMVCRDWSMFLPNDDAIYAGLDGQDRQRLRQALRR